MKNALYLQMFIIPGEVAFTMCALTCFLQDYIALAPTHLARATCWT